MKIAIIGAGGIGSHFCRILKRMLDHNQLGQLTPDDFSVFDFDVVEMKNVKWQDYEKDEIGAPKATLMTLRYEFNSVVKRFDEDDVAQYSRYLVAADNAKVRRIVFEHAKAADKKFVDMRSEGDMYAVFTDGCSEEELIESLGNDADSEEGRSCQRFLDQERNVIQVGNWMAATMGMDTFLRQSRKIRYPKQVVRAIL